jgi:DNA-binding HxlR family transcriptional regulator
MTRRYREDVVGTLRSQGMTISSRSVSRVLKSLVDKGYLIRAGNGYEPTDAERAGPRQGTL